MFRRFVRLFPPTPAAAAVIVQCPFVSLWIKLRNTRRTFNNRTKVEISSRRIINSPGGGAGKWHLGHFECRCCLLPHQNNGLDLPFNQQAHYPFAHYLRYLQLSLSLLFSTSRPEGWGYIECTLYKLMTGIPNLPVKWNLIPKVFI